MLTDVFYKREKRQFFPIGEIRSDVYKCFTQVGQLIFELDDKLNIPDQIFINAHQKLAQEIGWLRLENGKDDIDICFKLLFCNRYNPFNSFHGDTNHFVKIRISIIELLFRELEEFVESLPTIDKRSTFFRRGKALDKTMYRETLFNAIEELNIRLQDARLYLHYHNGYIQSQHSDIAAQSSEESFWILLKDKKFINVDEEVKKAITFKNNNDKKMAAFHAFLALESTIKIISDEKGFTKGKEKGAASYIDNLQSRNNRRFIEVWEADILKTLFSNIRNPQGHGAGSEIRPELKLYQLDFAIESAMTWIKSLIKRL